MRRDPASLFWLAFLGVGAVLIAAAVGAYLLAPDTPPNHFYAVARIVLIVGLAFALVAFLGLAHVGLENMGKRIRLHWPFRSPVSVSTAEIAQEPKPLTADDIRGIVREAIAEARPTAPVSSSPAKPAPIEAAKPVAPPITGDTTVAEVLGPNFRLGTETPDQIDYYYKDPGSRRYWKLKDLMSLSLGEMALIRRLAVAQKRTEILRKCNAVLEAAGVRQSNGALSRLEGKDLIVVSDNNVELTEVGFEYTWAFTQWLIHSPALVAAYRQITPKINKSVMFDDRKPA